MSGQVLPDQLLRVCREVFVEHPSKEAELDVLDCSAGLLADRNDAAIAVPLELAVEVNVARQRAIGPLDCSLDINKTSSPVVGRLCVPRAHRTQNTHFKPVGTESRRSLIGSRA